MSAKIRACLGAMFVNIVWGLSFIGSKKSMAAGLQPFSLVTVRFAVATVLLFALAAVTRTDLRLRRRDLPAMIISAVMGTTVYFYFELNGLLHSSAATAALIVAAIPVLTMVSGVLLHHRRPGIVSWIGAAFSLCGVYLVVSGGGEGDSVTGVLFMCGACICWVIYLECSHRLLQRNSSLSVTCWQSLFSLISLIPLTLTESTPWTAISAEGWLWAALFLGVIASGICYIFNNYAVAQLAPERTAIFLNLNPIAAAVGSVLLLGEELTVRKIIGGIIVLICLFLVVRPAEKQSS